MTGKAGLWARQRQVSTSMAETPVEVFTCQLRMADFGAENQLSRSPALQQSALPLSFLLFLSSAAPNYERYTSPWHLEIDVLNFPK